MNGAKAVDDAEESAKDFLRKRRPSPAYGGLRPPRTKTNVVARPDLTENVFQNVLDKRLCLVCAPSGYGKTTLLAEVFRRLDATDVPHIWLSGTHADRDATWIDAMLAEQLAHCFDLTDYKGVRFSELVRDVFSGQPVVVFFDNWDFLETNETNRYFDRLLEETEDFAHFIVSSRSLPGIAFEVYRIAGDLTQIGVEDLRLDETKCLEILGPSYLRLENQRQAAKLLAQTEGWPAGVQLLRLALEQSPLTGELEFSGTRDDVSTYLQETLFSRIDAETRTFMCQLAYLDELSLDLVAAVFADTAAKVRFVSLRREHMLLNEVSEGSFNYRFHTLLRDFLLAHAADMPGADERDICERASRYYSARNEDAKSISYAVRAGNIELALSLIEKYAEQRLVSEGRIKIFTDWVQKLLEKGTVLPPPVEYWYRWCLVFTGRWEVAAELKHADSDLRACIIDAVIGAFSDDQKRLHSAVRQWALWRPEADPFNQAVMYCASAISEAARGNYKAAWNEINKAKLVIRQTDGSFGRTWVNIISVLVDLGGGRIGDARIAADAAIAEADRSISPMAPIVRMARMTRALVAYHAGDDSYARECLFHANMDPDDQSPPILSLQAAHAARELGVFWKKRPFEEKPPSIVIDLVAEALSLDAQLRDLRDTVRFTQQIDALEDRIEAAEGVSPGILDYGWLLSDLRDGLLIRLAIAEGDLQKAQALISPALNRCQRNGRGLSEMRLSLLKAIVLYRQDKSSAALRLLIQQAQRAVSDELIRPFMELQHLLQPMIPELIEAGKRSPIGDDASGWQVFCERLGVAAENSARPQTVNSMAGLERTLQVTAREIEILSFVDLGLSNGEIGQRLGISIPTVKWHLANLYSKINVKNRASAIRYARDNGLV